MKTVLIVAAGKSERIKSGISKIRYCINGKEVFLYSVEKFQSHGYKVILVVNQRDYQDILDMNLKDVTVLIGGESRSASVLIGLNEVNSDYCFIHDAARPYITSKNIIDLESKLPHCDAIFLAKKPVDSIKKISENRIDNLNRNEYLLAETPQCFKTEKIKEAYQTLKGSYTDDISIYMDCFPFDKIDYCLNETNNNKITYESDLIEFEKYLDNESNYKIGHSYDIHRLVVDRPLILGGVKIPYHLGLLGHSDADALTHAIIESIIGALGLGDIGTHFPDNDPKYKGISSLKLLREIKKILSLEKYSIVNIDAIIYAEKPKMLPFINEMASNISDTLEIERNKINIKATTYEGLDAIGRNEAIASEAICLLRRN